MRGGAQKAPRSHGKLRARVALTLSFSLVGSVGMTALAPAAQGAAVTSYTLVATAALRGAPKPYTLTLIATKTAGAATGSLAIILSRTSPLNNHPTQSHYFGFSGVQFSCQSDLDTCRVKTGTAMGKYGQVRVMFVRGAPRQRSVSKCKDGTKSSSLTKARGKLGGLFELATSTSFFRTITNGSTQVHIPSKITATATKSVFYKNCPGVGGTAGCSQYLDIRGSRGVTGTDSVFIESGRRPVPTGKARLEFTWLQSSTSTAPASIIHTITGSAPGAAVTAAPHLASGTVDVGALAPMAKGKAHFTANTPISVYDTTTCKRKYRYGVLTGGAGVFDGWGTRKFNTSTYSSIERQIKV